MRVQAAVHPDRRIFPQHRFEQVAGFAAAALHRPAEACEQGNGKDDPESHAAFCRLSGLNPLPSPKDCVI
jgi:hypothetical protein